MIDMTVQPPPGIDVEAVLLEAGVTLEELEASHLEWQQEQAQQLAILAQIDDHRAALQGARALLLAYGTPDGLSFVETYSAVQTAVLEYRDSGIKDEICDDHREWMIARVGEITASALYSMGVLQ